MGILAIHAVLIVAGSNRSLNRLFETIGLSREGFLSGKIWQIGSYGLLHGSFMHVALNSLFLILIGSRIEFVAGRAAMVKTTAFGVIGGGIAHLLLGSGLLVGLSGGCMALLLMLTTLSPQSRMMPFPVSGRSLGLGVLIAELFLTVISPGLGCPGLSALGRWLAANGMDSWFSLGHACHFGGGLVGWFCGRWLLRPRITLARLRRDRARREAGRPAVSNRHP